MATITPSWTENQTDIDFSDTSPADTIAATCTIDLAANGYDLVSAQIKWTNNSTATDYSTIAMYSSPDSGVTIDDIPIWSQQVTTVSNTQQEISISISNVPFVMIEFTNDTTQEVTGLDLVYAGRKWVSA